MKTITFEGTQYEVEDWVAHVARSPNGDIVGYEVKPYTSEGGWYIFKGGFLTGWYNQHRMYVIGKQKNWIDSLVEV
jgi:hypothetical protein